MGWYRYLGRKLLLGAEWGLLGLILCLVCFVGWGVFLLNIGLGIIREGRHPLSHRLGEGGCWIQGIDLVGLGEGVQLVRVEC